MTNWSDTRHRDIAEIKSVIEAKDEEYAVKEFLNEILTCIYARFLL